jgi:pimeloyl-ACP methyl ester carboxylesterase
MADAGVASLRFDLRGHGESEGRQEELTLSSILNDIRVAIANAREATGATVVSLLGASFGGGICGYYAAKQPDDVARLVLLNPQFNYKWRTIDSRPYWHDDHLDGDMVKAGLVSADVCPPRPDGPLRGRGLPGVHRADAGPHLDLSRRQMLRLLLPVRHRPVLRPDA